MSQRSHTRFHINRSLSSTKFYFSVVFILALINKTWAILNKPFQILIFLLIWMQSSIDAGLWLQALSVTLSIALQVVRRTILPTAPTLKAPSPRVRKVTLIELHASLTFAWWPWFGDVICSWFLFISSLWFNLLIYFLANIVFCGFWLESFQILKSFLLQFLLNLTCSQIDDIFYSIQTKRYTAYSLAIFLFLFNRGFKLYSDFVHCNVIILFIHLKSSWYVISKTL